MYASRMPSESATSERASGAPRHCLGATSEMNIGLGLR